MQNSIVITFRYAQAPVGKLRFKSPQPYKYDKNLVDVSAESNVLCPQINFFIKKEFSNEDCLVLNIYIPDIALPDVTNGSFKLPVMFWIHGGGFIIGSGKF